MRDPIYGGWDLTFDDSSLKSCFEKQQRELLKRRKKPVPDDLGITFRESSWEKLSSSLCQWLFKYVDDSPGLRLEDPANAFSISESCFRDSVAKSIADSIRSATNATSIWEADVPSEYFMGGRFLFDSSDSANTFYELRIGYFF